MSIGKRLHWWVLGGVLLGAGAGLLTGTDAGVAGLPFYAVYDFLGTLFLNALKMLVVPLILSSIISGVANLGASENLGVLGAKTLAYYLTTSLLAILVGLFLVNLTTPGVVNERPAREVLGLPADAAAVTSDLETAGAGDLVGVFLRMVPENVVAAAVEGQMLGLIVFGLLFGFFAARLSGPAGESVRAFWQGTFDVMMGLTGFIMLFAPVGVFALVAKVVASTGLSAFLPLAVFFFTVLGALAVHFFVTLPLLLRLVGGVSPWRHYRAMAPALLTAFSTSSSSATLPLTMECVEKNAGVSNRVSSFVLPLGATVNMDGTALYECVAVLFIAQAYGMDLSAAQQFTVVVLALLTSIGVAGVPAASLVAITIILSAVGLPLEAVGLILAVDRLLDMCRTGVNVFSDSTGAAVIARTEGEATALPPAGARQPA